MERETNCSVLIQSAVLMSRANDSASESNDISALVERTLRGDAAAFEQIICRHERRIVSLAMKLLCSSEDAQDAAQEVFLRAFKYLHRLDVNKPIEPWLIQMTVNVCRDIGRQTQQRRKTFSETEPVEIPATGKSCDPHAEMVEQQQRDLLWKALNSLPQKERIAVILRDIEGLSTSEVAAILESSETTVRSQVSRARVRMRDAIDLLTGGSR